MATLAAKPAILNPVPAMSAVLCPLGFVHGYRCAACSWAVLFPDCHVSWAVPFCYQLQIKTAFDLHICGDGEPARGSNTCKLCRND